MKTLPPLMILCYGVGVSWYAKVIKEGHGEKWRAVEGREAQATTARHAVNRAISLYGKEPRTCRRCGTTWECKRTRTVRICPRCQQGRAANEEVALAAAVTADLMLHPLKKNGGMT